MVVNGFTLFLVPLYYIQTLMKENFCTVAATIHLND